MSEGVEREGSTNDRSTQYDHLLMPSINLGQVSMIWDTRRELLFLPTTASLTSVLTDTHSQKKTFHH